MAKRKRRLSMKPENVARRQKYAALRAMGLSPQEADKARGQSWQTIQKRHSQAPATDSTLTTRSLGNLPSKERYKQAYRLLRDAGFTVDEAKKLQTLPPEHLHFLLGDRRQRRRAEDTPPPATEEWEYHPMDKFYSTIYVYRTTFEVRHRGGRIEEKTLTIRGIDEQGKHRELTRKEVIEKVKNSVTEYGYEFLRIVDIYAMKAGLGGVR